MSEAFFPPPQKKESAPFRTAAVVAPSPAKPTPVKRPEPRQERVKHATAAPAEAPREESFLSTFLWRFGVKVLSLALVLGLLYGLVWAHEGGAKWPQVVIVALGAIGILASPFVLFFRLRRLWRSLFARDDAGT